MRVFYITLTPVLNTRLWKRKSNGNQPPTEGMKDWASLYIYIYFTDLLEIDFHIFTDIKISFNLWVRINYIITIIITITQFGKYHSTYFQQSLKY